MPFGVNQLGNKRKRAIDRLHQEKLARKQRRSEAHRRDEDTQIAPLRQPSIPLSIPRFILTRPVDENAPDYRQWTGITLSDGRRAVFAFSTSDNARKFCEASKLGPDWRIECLGYDALERWLEMNLREGDAVLVRDAASFEPQITFTADILAVLTALLNRDHDAGELEADFQLQFILGTLAHS